MVTANVVLDERRPKKSGEYPLKLRVTYNRKRKYYAIGIDVCLKDWEKINTISPRGDLANLRQTIKKIEVKAANLIRELDPFTFDRFEENFFPKDPEKDTLEDLFTTYNDMLRSEGRVKTAQSYQNARNSFVSFNKKAAITDVTCDYLKSYESFMVQKGISPTTIGIYTRSLRTIFNFAIEKGLVDKDQYPFGRRKYAIPAGRNIKKALTVSEIEKIYRYETIPFSVKGRAKDFWLFSYFCNGMNIKDICLLKFQDLDGDKIVFRRSKTERTKRLGKPVIAYLTDQAKEILARWANKDRSADNFIFPVLSKGLTIDQELAKTYQFVKVINKGMKQIAEDLKINKDVTTYTARHSFSTVLKRSGASVEFISESLGHSSKRTTELYLDSFEDETKKKFSEALTSFLGKESE